MILCLWLRILGHEHDPRGSLARLHLRFLRSASLDMCADVLVGASDAEGDIGSQIAGRG